MNLKEAMKRGLDPTLVQVRIPDVYRHAVGYKPAYGFLVKPLIGVIPGVLISDRPLRSWKREVTAIPLVNNIYELLKWEVM